MNLVIDIGNTLVKYAVFNNDNIIYSEKSADLEDNIILSVLEKYNIMSSILSSVRTDIMMNLEINILYLSHQTNLPYAIEYESSETLGNDRIANICGAMYLYPNQDILIIDAGSCITFDLIDKSGKYLGGRISPGLDMRYQSLNILTSKLPRLKIQKDSLFLGRDTESCIVSGVEQGVLSETDVLITEIKKEKEDLFVIVTGGNDFFFENTLKNSIFADSDLLMKGLNEILKHNV